jgi:methionyl-tRNA formyltransferase
MDFAARSATELYNRWRGFQPWPGAFTSLHGKKLIVYRMAIAHESHAEQLGIAVPGSVRVQNERLFVCCAGNTWLELLEVQLEGKKRLDAAQFLHGNPLQADAHLG